MIPSLPFIPYPLPLPISSSYLLPPTQTTHHPKPSPELTPYLAIQCDKRARRCSIPSCSVRILNALCVLWRSPRLCVTCGHTARPVTLLLFACLLVVWLVSSFHVRRYRSDPKVPCALSAVSPEMLSKQFQCWSCWPIRSRFRRAARRLLPFSAPLSFKRSMLWCFSLDPQQESLSWTHVFSLMCCHAEKEAANQTCYLTQSQLTNSGPTSTRSDPIKGRWLSENQFDDTDTTRLWVEPWPPAVGADEQADGNGLRALRPWDTLACCGTLNKQASNQNRALRPWDTLACCWDVKQASNQSTPWPRVVVVIVVSW